MTDRRLPWWDSGWRTWAVAVTLVVIALWVSQMIGPTGYQAPTAVGVAIVMGTIWAFATLVYRPLVRYWGIKGWLLLFPLTPVALILTVEAYVWFFTDEVPGVGVIFLSPIMWLALLLSGAIDFRPTRRNRSSVPR